MIDIDILKELLYELIDDQLGEFWFDVGSKKGKEFEKALNEVLEENLDNYVETLCKLYKETFEKYGVTNPEDIAKCIFYPSGYKLPEHLKHLEKIAPDIKFYVYGDIVNWISEMYEKAERRVRRKKELKKRGDKYG